jgi:hypothetical protein
MAPKVAEALRRIQPESLPVPQPGKDWAFCRIGGKLIPIHVQEVPEVYRQVQQLLSRSLADEPIPVLSPNRPEADALIEELVPMDVA